jgi:DNA adenine methylase
MTDLRAPFPWFGGKSRVAHLVWERFGNVANYVEPFAGSLAVLLARPHGPGVETVNDKDAFLCNFWRSIRFDPEATARWADWPVSEADLLARHRWLDSTGARRLELCKADPEFYDAKVAGWWVWGLCSWIGSGWCRQRGDGDQPEQLPHLGDAGMGINRKLPHLGDAGMGINRKLPHLGDAGRGRQIRSYFADLSERLRDVRICCGEWDRTVGDSVTIKHGVTGIFLDPPYDSDEHDVAYSAHSDVSGAVREWAVSNGANPDLRIALCGYDGEHAMPENWECIAWKARGGYGSQGDGRGRANAGRERIWFSPNCLKLGLFANAEATA